MSAPHPALRVLFVCTGNTCRSPLAAIALRAELGEDAEQIEVSSAGTAVSPGQPASEGSRRVAAADGFDLAAHRSRAVTADLVRAAGLRFLMRAEHRSVG